MKDKPYKKINENGETVYISLEEYRKEKVDDLRIRVPKGKKEVIQGALNMINETNGTKASLNTFVYEAIKEKIMHDASIDVESTVAEIIKDNQGKIVKINLLPIKA